MTRRPRLASLARLLWLAPLLALTVRAVPAEQIVSADLPVARTDRNSQIAHEQLLAKARAGHIDVYFIGDSITRRWGATDYPELLANWTKNFFGWNAGNFGWGADTIQNILWRLQNGELDEVHPKVIVVLAGTNNVGNKPPGDAEAVEASAGAISRGIKAILDVARAKAPRATIVVTAIFPRNDNIAVMPLINAANLRVAAFADGETVRYLNVNDRLADAEGKLFEGMTNDGLHLTVRGYQVWADALKPILTELLGPPATVDVAPPATGDPSRAPAR